MSFLKVISKKLITAFVLVGILHSFAYVYISIPIAQWFNTTEYVWNGRIWHIIALLFVVIFSLLPIKNISFKKFIVRFVFGIIITILASFLTATIVYFATLGGFGD